MSAGTPAGEPSRAAPPATRREVFRRTAARVGGVGGALACLGLLAGSLAGQVVVNTDRGYVLIENGTINVTSGDDGIKGFNDVAISGGSVTVSTPWRSSRPRPS